MKDAAEAATAAAGSRFGLIGAIVKRSQQLDHGVPPLVAHPNIEKHAMTAMREIAAGLVRVKVRRR